MEVLRYMSDSGPLHIQRAERPLTLCVVGAAASPHIRARAECFAERGHRVVLLTEVPGPAPGAGIELIVASTAPPRWMRGGGQLLDRILGPRGASFWKAWRFLTLLIRLRPDVVHVHYAYGFLAGFIGMTGCRPLVVTVMGGDVLFDEQGQPAESGKWLTGNLLKRADLITSKSDFLTGVMDRMWGVGGKCIRILWGIPVDRFTRTDAGTLARSLGIEGRRVLFSPRMLQPLYGIHLIVEAMPAILVAHPDVILLIAEYGVDAEYRERVLNRINELGISSSIGFCGKIAHADMALYYSLSALSVAVPSSDGMPQTLLEGMACGTPCVLSRLPRYEELISHGESAWMVEQTPEAISDGIIHLLDDPALCGRIAATARQIVETEGNLPVQAEQVEAAYYELIEKTGRRKSFGFLTALSCFHRYYTWKARNKPR